MCVWSSADPDVSNRSGYDMITGLETEPDTTEETIESEHSRTFQSFTDTEVTCHSVPSKTTQNSNQILCLSFCVIRLNILKWCGLL